MKTARKTVMLILCAILLVVATVSGTLAYLTDNDTVTNTFTVGKVGLNLDEAKTDLYGNVEGTTRTEDGNEYKLIPGHTYTKDPTVTVDADSEASYIRMIVTITDFADVKAVLGNDFLPQNFVNGWDPAVWVSTNTVTEKDDTAIYEFRYYTTVSTDDKEALKLEPLFTSFTLPGEVTNQAGENNTPVLSQLEEMDIIVEAHAIQADGFTDADAAWAAFKK